MPNPSPTWRLIDAGPLDGPANMALDEALLSSFNPESSLPVLRLYGWEPPALSLGRYQDAESSLRLDLCSAEGVPLVRRMTGGGIIYHGDEVTYSIVCSPEQIGDATGVKEGFRKLCGFLLETYRQLGLEAAFAIDRQPAGERLGERTAFCFAGKEEYDVVVAGRKIGGNAQRRMRGVIFQHGSIPLKSRVHLAARYLKEPADAVTTAVSLDELGLQPEPAHLKQLLVNSFQQCLGVRLLRDGVSEGENGMAAQLVETKYRCHEWNISQTCETKR
ncbi:biotin/lipoate A/B protein ligase family protein [Geomonas sp.]|uniref:lipoate--protein ligase family protein n=1 Tax=Geomonas sp. TaxID=2651584 RepID=UPI002B4772EE|nr:biotin/lipoate A/B protein ligase family protein [Geomonas sp.]HJV35917.1 biotin/lipoate A/B protein ligase family protein [Geomonas sp.]